MTKAEEMLTAVEAAITARLTGGAVHSYSIAGQNVQYMNITELYKIRDKLQAEVGAEKGTTRTYAGFRRPE